MGKREFLITAAFLVCGIAAYQISVPAEPNDESGFSLGGLIDEIRNDIKSESSSAVVTHTETIAVSPALGEIRLSGVTGQFSVTGEDRDDIAYELQVNSTGPSQDEARGYAARTVLAQDDLGEVLALRVAYPPEASQRTAIVLRVPRRLTVRLEGGREADVQDVGGLHLESVLGDVTVARVAGDLSGSHRSGRLRASDLGSVHMALRNVRATFEGVREGLTVTASGGECEVSSSSGAISVEQTNADVLIAEHAGPIDVRGTGGEIRLMRPTADVRVDMRRTEITVELAAAIAMTLWTTEDPIRLTLIGPPAIQLDALINGRGDIDADDFGLSAEVAESRAVLAHSFGDGTLPRVSLRNLRDDIVIRERR